MTTNTERRARRRFWAVMYGRGRQQTGYAHDFYPEEERPHRRDLEHGGARILGTFATREEAHAAVMQDMQRAADKLSRKRR